MQEIGWDDITDDEDIEWVRTVKAWTPAKAPEQEPCEDCISRQAVLDIVDGYSESQSNVEDVTQDIISDIMVLPPVTPQPKMGHWVDADGDNAICGCCNRLNHLYGKYCKHCGAKMQEIEENG